MSRKSEDAMQVLQELVEFETWLGMSGFGNIRQHIEGLHREIQKEKKKVQEFIDLSQTPHIGTAKNKFRSLIRNQKVQHDLTLIRDSFHKISSTWLDGVVKKGNILAEAPISYNKAQIEHEGLMPFIVRAHLICNNLENGETILDEFERDYLRFGRKQFGNKLYKFVEDIMEQEEDLDEEQTTKIEEASLSEMIKILNSKTDYGVVPKEQFTERSDD